MSQARTGERNIYRLWVGGNQQQRLSEQGCWPATQRAITTLHNYLI